MEEKKLLILDLDETLIYTSDETSNKQIRIAGNKQIRIAGRIIIFNRAYWIHERQHLRDFLEWCFDNFHIGFWTAASEDYAQEVLKYILPLGREPLFVYSSKKCTIHRSIGESAFDLKEYKIKNLKKVFKKKFNNKLSFLKKDVLIVDDTAYTFCKNYGNAILIKAFEGFPDDELLHLRKYLDFLLQHHRDRWLHFDKRNWRQQLS